ncbi:tRNA (N6-threonylcarbamoyladenosine(37)-N6)-methyltransferase TrmO [Haladaptatus sp. NG-SE-30]
MPTCEPIGRISTPFDTRDDAPRQGFLEGATGTISLDSSYEKGLDGFAAGDDVLVVWFADRADRSVVTIDRDGGRGVFTTRSPARPNPICLSDCEILDVEGCDVRVRGVDMIDGTPVLDLKPPIERD